MLNMASAPVPPGSETSCRRIWSKLGRAVTEGVDEDREFEAPPDSILDLSAVSVNNLAPSNVEKKAQELRYARSAILYWLGHFLVVKRISTQANFHSLYCLFLLTISVNMGKVS
jgi:CCR4-NOT transcription complex subunit 1